MLNMLLHTTFWLSATLVSQVFGSDSVWNTDLAVNGAHDRLLRAAKRDHGLGRRDVKGCLSNDHHLHYVDANTHASDSQFAAKVGVDFKVPALLLEDIEDHIRRVDCFFSSVYLYFDSVEALEHAHEEFTSVKNFLLITSHKDCNEDGERNPHMVSEASLHFQERLIILSVNRVPWKDTFNSMTVDFGESKDAFELRRHPRLEAREVATSSSPVSSASSAGTATASTTIVYPLAPTSTPKAFNATANISKQFIDTSILPADTSLGQVSVTGPKIPANFNIKCKNCTLQGSIELVAGSFTVGTNATPNEPVSNNLINETYNYVEHGFMTFRSNNFAAHIELDNSVKASTLLTNYTAPLPVIPITPFQIPGIASVGPLYKPQLMAGFLLAADLDFRYGFDMTVPNNSTVTLNIGQLNQSSQVGFDKTTISALPFQASIPSIALTFATGFSAQLLAGISFFSGSANAGAGLFLNFPTLTATFSEVNHTDSKCMPATDSTPTNDVFDTLTKVEAGVQLAVGVDAEVDVQLGAVVVRNDLPYTVLSTGYALPSACVSFDAGKKTFGVPRVTASSTVGATSTATATKGSEGAGGKGTSGASSAFGERRAGFGRVGSVAGLLVAVSFCFMMF